jgi:hypothetical protein
MTNPPLISPVFQVSGNNLQYKPYAEYPTWVTIAEISSITDIKARLPQTFSLMSDEFVWEAGTKAYAVSTVSPYNFIAFTTTLNAVARRYFTARAGTYTINILASKSNNAGKLDFALDGTPFLTALDLYAATAVPFFVQTVTGVVLNNNGDHEIAFSVPAKNPSSSAYYTGIFKIWGYKTS